MKWRSAIVALGRDGPNPRCVLVSENPEVVCSDLHHLTPVCVWDEPKEDWQRQAIAIAKRSWDAGY